MAFKQTLVHRIFNVCNSKFSNQTLRNCRVSPSASSSAAAASHVLRPPNPDRVAPDPGDETIFRRFLHPDILRPRGQSVMDRIKELDLTRGRIRLDVLSPPVERPSEAEFTVADAKKILRVSQIEKLKLRLDSSRKTHVPYNEFVQICVEECSNRDQGLDLAKALDDSGSVIVLGNVVFLKPEQVVKAIYGLLPSNLQATHDPQMKELEKLEQWKSAIDTKARKMVQRELWGGLAYLMVRVHEAHILGTVMGCDGAHLLLCYIHIFHGWLCIFLADRERAFVRRVLSEPV